LEANVDYLDDAQHGNAGQVPLNVLARSIPLGWIGYNTAPYEKRPNVATGSYTYAGLIDLPMYYRHPAYIEELATSVLTAGHFTNIFPLDLYYTPHNDLSWFEPGYAGAQWVSDGYSGQERSFDGFKSARSDRIYFTYVGELLYGLREAVRFLTRNDYNGQSLDWTYSSPFDSGDFGTTETYITYNGITRERPGRLYASQYWGDTGHLMSSLNGGTQSHKHATVGRIARAAAEAALENIALQLTSTIATGTPLTSAWEDEPTIGSIIRMIDKLVSLLGGEISWADHYIYAQPVRDAIIDAIPNDLRFGGVQVHHRDALTSSGASTERYLPYIESWIPNVILDINRSKRVIEHTAGV
jgi:hypothetical protein